MENVECLCLRASYSFYIIHFPFSIHPDNSLLLNVYIKNSTAVSCTAVLFSRLQNSKSQATEALRTSCMRFLTGM